MGGVAVTLAPLVGEGRGERGIDSSKNKNLKMYSTELAATALAYTGACVWFAIVSVHLVSGLYACWCSISCALKRRQLRAMDRQMKGECLRGYHILPKGMWGGLGYIDCDGTNTRKERGV